MLGSVINKDMLLGETVVLKIDHIPVSLQETEDPLRDKLSSPKMKSSITQATVPYLHAVQVHHPTQYGHFVHIRLGPRSQVPPSLFIYFMHKNSQGIHLLPSSMIRELQRQ